MDYYIDLFLEFSKIQSNQSGIEIDEQQWWRFGFNWIQSNQSGIEI